MLTLAAWLAGLLAAAALLPAAVFAFQVFAGLGGLPRPAAAGRRPRLAVLVPAHDEATVIAATLAAIRPQLEAGDRLLVVADNCSDDTAALARATGAEVSERQDEQRRGKGYALAHGVGVLAADAPEVVLIVDADCRVEEGAIDRLARAALTSDRPVQALYLMQAPPAAGLRMRIAAFAWRVKNLARPLGYARCGLPCQLMGSGMAFPWETIRTADLASGNLVEDLKLGLDCARAGRPPLFLPSAVVSSTFPANAEGARSQRKRWEHGHLGTMLAELPGLTAAAVARGNGALLALAFDLAVPPLAMLALAIAAALAAGMALCAAGASSWPLALAALAALLLTAAVFAAWAAHGRDTVSLADLLFAPIYALLKLPLYVGFLVRRQGEWVRSKRDAP